MYLPKARRILFDEVTLLYTEEELCDLLGWDKNIVRFSYQYKELILTTEGGERTTYNQFKQIVHIINFHNKLHDII